MLERNGASAVGERAATQLPALSTSEAACRRQHGRRPYPHYTPPKPSMQDLHMHALGRCVGAGCVGSALQHCPHQSISCDRRTILETFFLYSSRASRHIFAASTFAGDSSLGDESMLMMDRTIDSIECTGDHRSAAVS